MELKTPAHMLNDKVHLRSEQFTQREEFVSLTTTDAVKQFVEAWWGEFQKRDVTATSQRAIKLFTIFKASGNKPSLRPYFSSDNQLTLEPLTRPNINVSWLPQTGKKVELSDLDLQHFERQVRVGMRVANFMEALLQAWKYGDTPMFMLEKIISAIVHATKTQLQNQTALLSQIIQLRRDLFMCGATASLDVQQALRHAPFLGQLELFPTKTVAELDDKVKRSCETSLIVQTYRKSQSQQQSSQPKKRNWQRDSNDNQRGWGRSDLVNDTSFSSPTRSVTPTVPTKPVARNPVGFEFNPTSEWVEAVKALQTLSEEQKALPVGGRLKLFWKNWKDIGTAKRIYNWFRKGYRLPFLAQQKSQADSLLKLVCPDFLLSNYTNNTLKQEALTEIITKLLTKQAIEEVPENQEVVFNRVFLREKPIKNRTAKQEYRLIIDLTQINQFLKTKHFVMDTPSHIRQAILPGMWATSLDFSDAYHHIPIRPDFYKYLAFQFKNKRYWYKVCPFGLSPIPQVFTAAMEPLKIHARTSLGIATYQYIDDWLLLFTNPKEAEVKTIQFAHLCLSLGMLVNFDKSELAPTQQITHLGIEWNLQTAWVKPAKKQIQAISNGATIACEKGKAKLSQLESLRGKMVAAEKQTHMGRINFRMFQKAVTKALKMSYRHQWVKLPMSALEDLAWWSHQPNLARGVPCVPPKPTIHITTDASDRGWGAQSENLSAQGEWSPQQLSLHINHKELLAVLLTLQRWGEQLKGQTIQFWLDNLTAVAYLSNQGGTRSPSMTQTAKQLFRLANSYQICVLANYIPGALNVVADMNSRVGQVLKTEWMLSSKSFKWINQHNQFGTLELDLFANQYTRQLADYGSPCPDMFAFLIDALTADWPKDMTLYAYPPTCIMDKVVVKIQQEKPKRLLLVAPMHTKATWFPFVNQWSHSKMVIPTEVLQLEQPHFDHVHPNPGMLYLTMFHISFQSSMNRDTTLMC